MSSQKPSQRNGESQVGLGLCLDAEVPQVARHVGSPTEGHAGEAPASAVCVPPSCLLPRLAGEPVRADFSWPCHPRGSGQPWPPEAGITSGGAGRFPLVYAWSSFHQEAPAGGCQWSWPDGTRSIRASDAIAGVAAGLLERWLGHLAATEPVLIIPNHLKSADQQAIIDACRRRGIRVRLLWRPVAAALAWSDRYQQDLTKLKGDVDQAMGRVLAIHMGLDCLEVCLLEIVPQRHNREVYFLPARGRPQGRPLHGLGVRLIEDLACRFAKERMGVTDLGCVWGLLWASPWLPAALGILRGQSCQDVLDHMPELGSPSNTEELLNRVWPSVYAGLTGQDTSPVVPLRQMLPNFRNAAAVADWSKGQAETLRSTDALLGAVITGPLADILYEGKSLGERWLAKVGVSCERVLVEGRDVPRGVLAGTAATHSMRLAAGLPTYLDTLPRVKMVVTEAGEPIWINLLQERDAYVDGGQEWHREEVGKGLLSLMENWKDLPIDLNHEEYPTVRTVTSGLPEICRTKVPISLSVSVLPAQGNARVEVVPDNPGALGRHRVLVDWSMMQDTKNTPDEWMANLPRILPKHMPRRSSMLLWSGGLGLWGYHVAGLLPDIEQFLSAPTRLDPLHTIVEKLKHKDRSLGPGEYTAVDSEGRPAGAVADWRVLRRFQGLLAAQLAKAGGDERYLIVRALAYSSAVDSSFVRMIVRELRSQGTSLSSVFLPACGWCLRDPDHIRLFAEQLNANLRDRPQGHSDWLKAFWEILRYRGNATERLESGLCANLARQILGVVKAEFGRSNLKYKFRYASGCIVYLLRRRAYDPSYFDPKIQPGTEARRVFADALTYVRCHPKDVIGGIVRTDEELQKILNYIDKRGRGPILLGLEDDDER